MLIITSMTNIMTTIRHKRNLITIPITTSTAVIIMTITFAKSSGVIIPISPSPTLTRLHASKHNAGPGEAEASGAPGVAEAPGADLWRR